MTSPKINTLLLELGHLQVWGMQTLEEYNMKLTPSKIFWQKKGEGMAHGPFDSVFSATKNYASVMLSRAKATENSNVIYVDFKNKKRIR